MEEIEYSEEKLSLGIWKKVFRLVWQHKSTVIKMAIFSMLLGGLDVAFPLVNSNALKHFFTEGRTDKLGLFIFLYAFFALAYGIIIYAFIKEGSILEVTVAKELRKKAFERLQELPFSYFDKNPSGWIMSRLTSDARRLSEVLSWSIIDLLWSSVSMISILVVLCILNIKLALIILILTPLFLLVCFYFRKKILRAYRDVRKTNSEITAAFNEGILGAKTTKTLVLEEQKGNEFSALTHKMKRNVVRAISFSSVLFPIILLIGYIGVAFTLYEGVLLGIELATLYLFINYTTQFFDPVIRASEIYSEFQQAQAAAERVIGLMETIPEIDDSEDIKKKYGTILNPIEENYEKLVGEIEFKDVTFTYTGNKNILENFNLKIKAGQSIALVGQTGSGKSTIVNLLCRFYEPTSGTILIDGVDYKERSIGWLHSNLGYVLQSPHLFNGTVMENVKYASPNISDKQAIEACKKVMAHDFIMQLEKGYDTNVGEGGNKLSLGQKQLIAFARAIVADPSILILDEATSSIDTKTEYDIQAVINASMQGRTSICVAHRLSTIISADVIIVIQKGKIVEKGTHKELLELKGAYYNLYKKQFIDEETEKMKY